MGCDTICDLPDSLLTEILLNLPTKDSVKTSVLSTRWRDLWLSVPGLDLTIDLLHREEVFANLIDRFMKFNKGSCLQNFKIEQYNYYDRDIELINTVVDRGIQHLDVTIYSCNKHAFMRQSIYKSKTLVSLKLTNVKLKNPDEFVVSLPCLKIMELVNVCYGKDGPLVVEKLISGCPLLEDLKLITPFHIMNQQVVILLRVMSQTLKRFLISWGYKEFTAEIDAPRLEYLSLSNSKSDGIVVKNLSSLLKVNFNFDNHLKPEDCGIFCDFLTGISSVKHMIICQWTLKVLYCYSKLRPIPKFSNLYHLQVKLFSSWSQVLPALLESCPNLKFLSLLGFYDSKKPRQIDFTNVPQCLTSTLEYVEIRELIIMKEDDQTGIFKLVNYFLENSAILKKLTLSFLYSSISIKKQEQEYKKLLTSTKLSPTCQVIIH